jgi:hypothetical protein
MGGVGVFLLSPKGRDPLTPRERPGEGGVDATRLRLLLAQAAAGRTSVGKHFSPVVSDHLRRACEVKDIFRDVCSERSIFSLFIDKRMVPLYWTVFRSYQQILKIGTPVQWARNVNTRINKKKLVSILT